MVETKKTRVFSYYYLGRFYDLDISRAPAVSAHHIAGTVARALDRHRGYPGSKPAGAPLLLPTVCRRYLSLVDYNPRGFREITKAYGCYD